MDLADLDETALAALSGAELDAVLAGLAAQEYESRRWTLQARQRVAEDACLQYAKPGVRFELLYGGAVGGGKGLDLATPLATPTGWTDMASVRVGDTVFAGDGTPTLVTGTSAVHHRPCFTVTLHDGVTLTCDDEHRWLVWTNGDRVALSNRTDERRAKRRAQRPRRGTDKRPDLTARNEARAAPTLDPPTGRVVSTLELIDLLERERQSVAVAVQPGLALPERALPIDPYLLGCWLGDGSSGAGQITTVDPEILAAFACHYEVRRYGDKITYGVIGLYRDLRLNGLLDNKHVPGGYLRASDEQRLALLQGLMDTDGTANTAGSVSFTTTRPALRDGFIELVWSLGWRATVTERRAKINGRDCGPAWTVKFTPDRKVFRLDRKAVRQRFGGPRTRWRYITSVTPAPSTPTRCIAVAHPSRTYLAGREMIQTHNTLWQLYHLHEIALNYPGSRTLMLRRSYPELRRNAIFKSHVHFDRSRCRWVESRKEWVFDNGSIIELGYLDNDLDVYNYQGAEYFCVVPETEIVMGDGTLCRIDAIRPGDHVMTLEGPRRVCQSRAVPAKPTVAITTPWGTVIAAADHALLTAEGDWHSPAALQSTPRPASGTTSGAWPRSRQGMRQRRAYRKQAKRRDAALVRQGRRVVARRDSVVSVSHQGTDGATSCAPPQPPQPPVPWFASLAIHGLVPRQSARRVRDRVDDRATNDRAAPGSPADCHTELRCDDARPRPATGAGPAHTPTRGDVGAPSSPPFGTGDPARTPARSPGGTTYLHPYTSEARPLAVDVLHARASLDPAGVRDLWDIEVEGSNHYLSSNGSIHRNCVCWDELTQWPTDFAYTYLLSRLRTSPSLARAGMVPHMIAATNPGGVGGHWVKERFVDIGPPEVAVTVEEQIEDIVVESTRLYVPAALSDNRYIDRRSYLANLAGMTAIQRESLLNGSWDVIEGQYFTEWSRAAHVVEPFEVPSFWTRIRGLDYGFTNPMACVWLAFDPDGTGYVYRELYGTGMTPPIQAAKIVEMSHGEHVDYTVADPSIWAQTGVGMPIAQQYADAGLHCRRAKNARVDGWSIVRQFLRPDPERADPALLGAVDEQGKALYVPPRLYVFSHCRNLIRTLPMAVHDKTNPEDLDTEGDDHVLDSLRYALASRPRPTVVEKPVDYSLEARLARSHAERAARRGSAHRPFVGM